MPPTQASPLPSTHSSDQTPSISSEVDDCSDVVVPEVAASDSQSSISSQYCPNNRNGSKTYEFITFSPESLKHISRTSEPAKQERYTQVGEQCNMTFKMLRCDGRLVRTLLHSYGFTQCSNKNPSTNLIWTGSHLKAFKMRALQPWQRLNQFPRSTELTRKDKLYENIARSQALFGEPFDFIPEFYVTPRDSVRMQAAFDRSLEGGEKNMFIVKPVSASQGRGIFFADKVEDVPLTAPLLVSRYLDKPLLANGHKFDLRIYVAVTSFYPLVAYVYSEGLTRLASGKYAADSSPENEFVHLTNYSINKNSKDFVRNESMSSEDVGHKWTLGALLRYLETQDIDSRLLMLRIEDLIIKSLLSVQNTVVAMSRTNLNYIGTNFELFGFDVLIDEDLKPWLLEVNLSPSLSCDAPLDALVKTRLICDLFNLACVPLVNKKNLETIAKQNEGSDYERDVSPVTHCSPRRSSIVSKSSFVRRFGTTARELTSNHRSLNSDQRLRLSLRKLRAEESRKGDFIRIFPRRGSFEIYRHVMEHSGYERFDHKVYEEEYGEVEEMKKLAAEFHQVMMMSAKYPSLSTLSFELQSFIDDWYESADAYTAKITKEGETYAPKLPAMRPEARLRTQSCSEWYEIKKAERAEAKAKAAALEQINTNPVETAEKENASPCKPDVVLEAKV